MSMHILDYMLDKHSIPYEQASSIRRALNTTYTKKYLDNSLVRPHLTTTPKRRIDKLKKNLFNEFNKGFRPKYAVTTVQIYNELAEYTTKKCIDEDLIEAGLMHQLLVFITKKRAETVQIPVLCDSDLDISDGIHQFIIVFVKPDNQAGKVLGCIEFYIE